ncbi:MAG TPA: hypothetical protein PJ994_09805 [Tepidiformaceae bacterium]|nr:hypothetical protein [Tepidiformaceae bacterium]HMO94784.1 hypothetical protein [Tepidiformaceae bacterium]
MKRIVLGAVVSAALSVAQLRHQGPRLQQANATEGLLGVTICE